MLDFLTSPLNIPLSFTYIDDSGGVKTLHGDIECYINTESNSDSTWKSLVKKMNNNINIINGYSNYNTYNDNELSTNKFVIRGSNMTYNIPMFGYLGSIKSIIEDSLKSEIATMLCNVGTKYSTIYVKFTENVSYLSLMYFDTCGFSKYMLKYSYVFNDVGTVNNNALNTLDDLRNVFSKFILCDSTQDNTSYYYKGDCLFETTFIESDDYVEKIKNDINMNFKNVIESANISTINYDVVYKCDNNEKFD